MSGLIKGIFGGGGSGANKQAERDARIRAREANEDAARQRQQAERAGRATRGRRQLLRFAGTLGQQAQLGAQGARPS